MAYDGLISLRAGEKKVLYGQAMAAQGDTLTIQASPAPTFTLYDSTGAIVSAFNAVAVTGYDGAAASSVRAWYNLDTSTLTPGCYYAIFAFSVKSSGDGMTRNLRSDTQTLLLSTIEVAATYDPSTPAGKLRLLISDTNPATAIFSDAEVNAALSFCVNDPAFGASFLLTSLASDAAQRCVSVKNDIISTDLTKQADDLRTQAQAVRAFMAIAPVVIAPPAVFTMGDPSKGTVGTMDIW